MWMVIYSAAGVSKDGGKRLFMCKEVFSFINLMPICTDIF